MAFRATANHSHTNPLDGVQGSFAATVLDSVTGCATHTVLAAGEGYGTPASIVESTEESNNVSERQQIAGLDVYVEGSGEQIIVMLHGWPDTYRVWDAQVAAFASDYRCVRITLPNYAEQGGRMAYTIASVAEMIGQVVQVLSPDRPVILLLHDWGCVFGYQFYRQHSDRVSRMIALDIGDAASPQHLKSLKAHHVAMLVTYQSNLALAWLMPEKLGTAITRGFARLLQQPTPVDPVHRGMNYPYFQAVFQAVSQPIRPFTLVPDCPILFVYAKHKPFMFHSKQWLTQLQEKTGNQVTAMKAGHWLMREQPEQFNQLVLDWLHDGQS